MQFEIKELEYFVAVAEELNFAKAADRVGISQSPLSKAIATLERNLGMPLFVREKWGTSLTPAGESLLRDARRVLAAADDAKETLLALSRKS